jgi:hypothetical protein
LTLYTKRRTDTAKLKAWFDGVLPEYSKDKVYTSDIKKVAQWYNILHKLNLLVKEEPEKAAEEKAPEEKPAKKNPAPAAEKKKKKTTPKPKTE